MPISAKALQSLARFPVTDLAFAIARNAVAREAQLKRFLRFVPNSSYQTTRNAVGVIYGVELPLAPAPTMTWAAIKTQITALAKPKDVARNLEASQSLFDLIRPLGYQAYPHEQQTLKVGTGRVVPIDIRQYVVDGDRLIFQYVHPRREWPDEHALVALASIVHHAYATGDFAHAEFELVDLSCNNSKARTPCIRQVSRADILGRDELRLRIEEIYGLLLQLAEDEGS